MLDTLKAWLGLKKAPESPVEAGFAGSVLGDFSNAVAGDAQEYRGETRKPLPVPIAPRNESVSFAAMEAAPELPEAPAPEPERRIAAPSPARAADDKGWDLLGDDE